MGVNSCNSISSFMTALTLLKEHFCFGGQVAFYRHSSQVCRCDMNFSVFVPAQAQTKTVPILYYLSGLTCTEENFITKAGTQRLAAEQGIMLVAPDTSPRGKIIPDDDNWDLGTGAGFYVDATESPWCNHYQMYSYITQELPALIIANFNVNSDRQGIFGHSMGGHGALVCGLKHPELFKSISAFAPIVAPSQCPWGQKAFSNYLGVDQDVWKAYDATELIKIYADPSRPILIDQGTKDSFLENQLMPDKFVEACQAVGQPVNLRLQEGYDHSYFFISSFIDDHILHHAVTLCQ